MALGAVLSAGSLILLARLLQERDPVWLRILTLVAALAMAALLLPAGGRGPIVALVLSAAVAFGVRFFGQRQALKQRFQTIGAAVLVTVLAGVVVLQVAEEGTYGLALTRFSLLTSGELGDSAGLRVDFFFETIALIQIQPILGVGLGGWPSSVGLGYVRGYPHNLFLETQAEAGIVGTVLLLLLLAYSTRVSVASHASVQRFTALLVLCNFSVNAMFSGDLSDNRMFFWGLGLLVAAATSQAYRRKPNALGIATEKDSRRASW